jgi:hypothetical protein
MPKPAPEPAWARELGVEVSKTLIPFMFGPSTPGDPARIRNGTCSVVEIGPSAFLLTAEHVLTSALESMAASPNTMGVYVRFARPTGGATAAGGG